MRILFWNNSFLPTIGGVEIFTARLAEQLVARGHEIFVVAPRYPAHLPEREQFNGYTVIRLAFLDALVHGGPDPRAGLRLMQEITSAVAKLKRTFRPGLLHVNLADASPIFHLRTSNAHPCPTVVAMQSALLRRSDQKNSLTATVLKSASRVVAVSRAAAANIAEFTDISLADIDVIAPGIPAGDFTRSLWRPASRARDIVFVGRLVPEKGADTAIRAMTELDGARLRIVGDGPELGRLQALARESGVASRVSFEGLVDDETRRQILSDGFAMVVPSRHEELFGMVAVEGAFSGLPVVASATGGLQEIVEPGLTGSLFPAGDASALAECLRKLLADPDAAYRMGQAGRVKALSRYTIEHTADRYERLYSQCAASSVLTA
jgi:glycosyltransferase involved in cell wall biosynthesis